MLDPIPRALDHLADGLRPFVLSRLEAARGEHAARSVESLQDAQAILLFMWDNWNELFRTELTYVERSLVSELREFRNRWAHQHRFTEQDIYRFLDGTERLLTAVKSPRVVKVQEIRRQSLERLYEMEFNYPQDTPTEFSWKPMMLSILCAVAIDVAVLSVSQHIVSVVLAFIVLVLFIRIGGKLMAQQKKALIGPRECAFCGKIVYSSECPYCSRQEINLIGRSVIA